MARATLANARLGRRERLLLLTPAAIGGALGLGLLLLPGNRFVGAEGLACAAGLALALRQGDWPAARLPALAALAIYATALGACLAALASGATAFRIVLGAGAATPAATAAAMALYQRRGAPRTTADVGGWVAGLIAARTVVAALLGLVPLLAPALFAHTFGVAGVDLFLYRLGGAALVGYAVMGVGELRSRSWRELRGPALMVLMLAGLCAVVSLVSLALGERSALGYLVAALASAVMVATAVELRRAGK